MARLRRGDRVKRSARAAAPWFCAGLAAFVVLLPAAASTGSRSKYGGTLVIGLSGGDPDSLDPTVSRGSGIAVYADMCLKLYESVRNHGSIVTKPLLAAALPVLSKNRLSYTIRLRKGVQFNDGTPLDAQAVVSTVQRFMTFPGSSRASDFANVASVSAAGQYTVVFRLKAPDSTLVSTQLYVLSPTAVAKEGSGFAADPVCAGPFMFDHRVAGDNITLVKSPYWYERDAVHLDKIVFRPMPDATAAAAALRAGDIQALDQVSPSELPAVQADPDLRVMQSPELGWRGLIINIGNKSGVGNPYANVGTPLASSTVLRQAFEEAIDRATLDKVVFQDLFQPTCTPIPPANTAWFPLIKVPCTPYDPADAKRLVAKSGFTNPTVHLLTANLTDRLRAAQVIQAEEAAVGINVVIDSTDSATALARAAAGAFDTTLTGLEPGSVEPNTLVYQFFGTTGVRNYGGYSNARADYVLNNGLKAAQIRPRAVNYHTLLQILHDDRPAIFLYNETSIAAYSADLTGMQMEGNGQLVVAYAQYK